MISRRTAAPPTGPALERARPHAADRRQAPRGRRPAAGRVLWHLAAIGVTALFLLPLLWMVVASLQPAGMPPARTLTAFPYGVAWANYA
ncbi:MAG: hypothetical protein KDD77_20805 [Caldilineaceae bacterium]|nr:hypothetical protein [Caldilineaceae bacterium]